MGEGGNRLFEQGCIGTLWPPSKLIEIKLLWPKISCVGWYTIEPEGGAEAAIHSGGLKNVKL